MPGALAYNNLLWFTDDQGTIGCELCTSWEISPDSLTHTFKLHQGVKFHSGEELTSADVKWTIEKWMGKIDGVASPRIGPIASYVDTVEAPDPYTVVVRMKRPAPSFPVFIAHDYGAIIKKDSTQEQLKAGPQGTGPFIVKQHIRDSSITYERNPNYFKPGLPYLDQIELVIIRDEPAVRTAFATGNIDWTDIWPDPSLKPRYDQLEAEGKIKQWRHPHHWMQGLAINVTAPPLNDPRVRQAINLALDRDSYEQVILFGFGGRARYWAWPVGSPWNPYQSEDELRRSLPGWARTGPDKEAERQQAKQLLAEAGYPNGFNMELLTESNPRTNEWVASQLQTIGIRATVVTRGDIFDELFAKGEYDAASQGYLINTGDPDEVLYGYFYTGGSRNYPQYSNPAFDALVDQQSAEPDPVRRRELVMQALKILDQDMTFPQVPRLPDYVATASYVGGYTQPAITRDMRFRRDFWWDKRLSR